MKTPVRSEFGLLDDDGRQVGLRGCTGTDWLRRVLIMIRGSGPAGVSSSAGLRSRLVAWRGQVRHGLPARYGVHRSGADARGDIP
jgi:hypothetical protein